MGNFNELAIPLLKRDKCYFRITINNQFGSFKPVGSGRGPTYKIVMDIFNRIK